MFASRIKRHILKQTSAGAKELFLDSAKFKETGSFRIYNNTAATTLRVASFGCLYVAGYFGYDYLYGEEELDKVADIAFASMGCLVSFWLFYSVRRTLKSIDILKDGKTLVLERYGMFGVRGLKQEIYHSQMLGTRNFIHPKVRMP